MLSGGEKQRLAFARLLYHRPTFAVLDEATAAVNGDAQEGLYQLLREAGTTVFSIAHRPEIWKFHQLELRIHGDGEGAWSLRQIHSRSHHSLPLPEVPKRVEASPRVVSLASQSLPDFMAMP